jgi:hypothetical protein
MASIQSTAATRFGKSASDEFVEIALLVPTNRVEALVDLSRRRHQTIAQILRSLIDRELAEQE